MFFSTEQDRKTCCPGISRYESKPAAVDVYFHFVVCRHKHGPTRGKHTSFGTKVMTVF